MNVDHKSPLFNKSYLWNWKFLLKYELMSWLGRTFHSKKAPQRQGKQLLHLGCGTVYLPEFVNADFFYLRWLPFRKQQVKVDWLLDFRYPLRCPDNFWDGVFTEHTLEHLHPSDVFALLKELHRTLKKGAWVRICVPGLMQTLGAFDLGIAKDVSTIDRGTYVSPAEALHDLTQNWGHLSVWDGDLFCALLHQAGFEEAMTMSYKQGNDPQILQDSESRCVGSLYVEARK